MRDTLTVLTTTNFVPSCPSTALIESVIANFNQKFGVTDYTHLIFYDRPRVRTPNDDRYLKALLELDAKFPSSIRVMTDRFVGLRGGWLRLMAETKTPYFLFLEHDWHFTGEPVPALQTLVAALERHPFVNYLRFNKMKGTIEQWGNWDRRHEQESRVSELSLTKIWSWSNNPHLGRTEMVKSRCVPEVERYPFPGALDPAWQGWPCGVEGRILDAIARDVEMLGFDSAHERWGTYFIGAPNSTHTVHHVCGRSFRVPADS